MDFNLKNISIFEDGENVYIQIKTDAHRNEYCFESWEEAIDALPSLDELQ